MKEYVDLLAAEEGQRAWESDSEPEDELVFGVNA